MPRVAPPQPDLFTPPPEPEPVRAPERPPLDELRDMLALLRDATCHPWPSVNFAMEQERRALWLGKLAGPEGKALASAIFAESERLFSAAERAALA